jgi:hypothetical protein
VPNQNRPTFKQVKPTSAAHAAPEDLFCKLSGAFLSESNSPHLSLFLKLLRNAMEVFVYSHRNHICHISETHANKWMGATKSSCSLLTMTVLSAKATARRLPRSVLAPLPVSFSGHTLLTRRFQALGTLVVNVCPDCGHFREKIKLAAFETVKPLSRAAQTSGEGWAAQSFVIKEKILSGLSFLN